MKRVALIGSPISHSLSPAIHQAAFRTVGLSWRYSLQETKCDQLAKFIHQLRRPEWQGANVTIPLKTRVAAHLDTLGQQATAIGAVNTILKQDDQLLGDNTDADGFINDLKSQTDVEIREMKVVLLGSGGAARAVAYALGRKGAAINLVARDQKKTQKLIAALPQEIRSNIRWHPWDLQGFSDAGKNAHLVVNATPIGMSPMDGECPWPPSMPLPAEAFIYDLVYRPTTTQLVSKARQQGLAACSGLGMLIEQAALSFELWTGVEAPKQAMQIAAQEALEAVNA